MKDVPTAGTRALVNLPPGFFNPHFSPNSPSGDRF